MRWLLYVVLIFYNFACRKSKDIDYSQYSAIDNASKHPLVTENFVDNRNRWNYIDTALLYNPDTYPATVCQFVPLGQMNITANIGIGDQYFRYDSLVYLQNFELESEIKFVQVKPNLINDTRGVCYMNWGFSSPNNHVNFIKFENNGLVDFGDSQGLTRSGSKIEGLNLVGYNKYTIRKAGDIIYYFVNEKFIGTSKLQLIAGNNIGFRIFTYNVFYIRNFKFVRF